MNNFSDLKDNHYDYFSGYDGVYKLVRIDLTPSISLIDKKQMLAYFQPFRWSPIIWNLINRFMDLQIIGNNGTSYLPTMGIPPCGELTNVLFHIYYQYAFDIPIEERYPLISYTRWGHEVFIAIKEEHNFLLEDHEVNTFLLQELNLAGDIQSCYHGDEEHLSGSDKDQILYVEYDGEVKVEDVLY